MNLRQQIEGFEGRRHRAYPDPLTGGAPLTIGVGHCGPDVHEGLVWTDEQIDAAFDADIAEKISQCRAHFPWFDRLNEPRRSVIAGMCFQMGLTRLLGFTHMLGDIRDERWANAAENIRASVWARQTPKRAIRLAHQLETGEW